MADKALLAGAVALVTGGGGEIGGAICRRFAAEGASVVVADIEIEKALKVVGEIEAAGGKAAPVRLDVCDPKSCEDAVAFAVKTFGKLTTLANVAAAATPLGDAEKLSLENWNKAFQVNVTGQFLMSKFAVAAMREAGGGAIVSIASSHGHIGMPGRPAYCASKAAVLQLTKCLAIDFAPYGIRANTISPGAIDTERAALQRFKSREEANRAKGPAYLVGRTGKVEEIAAGAVYLASGESAFMTGTDLLLDGGYLAFKGTTTNPV
ncbi:MAG: SDR family oxidoreductase [Beijerinckiaceae bacterium]|nr:SDR family oxidoreductase [Beijerinckiaceae bacterium]